MTCETNGASLNQNEDLSTLSGPQPPSGYGKHLMEKQGWSEGKELGGRRGSGAPGPGQPWEKTEWAKEERGLICQEGEISTSVNRREQVGVSFKLYKN